MRDFRNRTYIIFQRHNRFQRALAGKTIILSIPPYFKFKGVIYILSETKVPTGQNTMNKLFVTILLFLKLLSDI